MAKLKAKTKSSAKKRFRLTGSGKLINQSAGASHIRRKKSANTLKFKMCAKTTNDAILKMTKKLLPNGVKGRRINKTVRGM
ncbi:MAG: 50S ribosomal protein L35 [Caldisericia bacterium]|nr:50S ribosomal protein L35 [Caldisericia bacterium]